MNIKICRCSQTFKDVLQKNVKIGSEIKLLVFQLNLFLFNVTAQNGAKPLCCSKYLKFRKQSNNSTNKNGKPQSKKESTYFKIIWLYFNYNCLRHFNYKHKLIFNLIHIKPLKLVCSQYTFFLILKYIKNK